MGQSRRSQGYSSTSYALTYILLRLAETAAAEWQEQPVVADRSPRPQAHLLLLLNAVLRWTVFKNAEDIVSISPPCPCFRVYPLGHCSSSRESGHCQLLHGENQGCGTRRWSLRERFRRHVRLSFSCRRHTYTHSHPT